MTNIKINKNVLFAVILVFGLLLTTAVNRTSADSHEGSRGQQSLGGSGGLSNGSGGARVGSGGGYISGGYSSGFSSSGGVSYSSARGIANSLNSRGSMPPGHSASVVRNSGGSYAVSIGANNNAGGGGGNSSAFGGGGAGGSSFCLPDLRVNSIRLLDAAGNSYALNNVPLNVAITPIMRVRNASVCGTDTSSTAYLGTSRGGVVYNQPYQSWRNVPGQGTGGSFPIRLRDMYSGRLMQAVYASNVGPVNGQTSVNVTLPTMTFTNVGNHRLEAKADVDGMCSSVRLPAFASSAWRGCIWEDGILSQGWGISVSTGSGNENNNTLSQLITVVANPVAQCDDGHDNDGDGLADAADPGCWSTPGDPSTYDRTDDDENNGPVAAPGSIAVNVRATTDGGTTYINGPGPITITAADIPNLEIRWDVGSTGTGLDCDGTNDFTEVANQGSPGQRNPMTDPVAGGPVIIYGITCTDSNGTDSDTISVRVPASPNGTQLDVKKISQSTWTTDANVNPFIITTADNTVDLRWNSPLATSCLGSAIDGPGSNSAGPFNTGGFNSGTRNVNSPSIGSYALYGINCTNTGGNQTFTIEVQRPAPAPILTITNPATGQPATLVEIGTTVNVAWDANGNDPDECGLVGPNWTINNPLPSETGNANIVIQGESDFVLDCLANTISPTTNNPINPDSSVTKRVNVTSDFSEN